MGWGATCNGQAASGLWTGPRLLWHINCLELWTVHLALRQFRPLLLGNHVLVHTDITAAVSYINRLGGIRSHRMSQLACHLLHYALSTSQGSSIVRPTRSHDSSYPPENDDSIPRRYGLSEVDLGKLRWTCLLPTSPPTASCIFPWPRAPSARMHWHTAGLRLYASMLFLQWVYLHRHCASSERTRSRSCWLRHIGPPGPSFPNSYPSRQHLPGAFLWGRTSSLRGSAPYGTRVQICRTFMCGSWTGRGRLERSTTGSGRDHHSG